MLFRWLSAVGGRMSVCLWRVCMAGVAVVVVVVATTGFLRDHAVCVCM